MTARMAIFIFGELPFRFPIPERPRFLAKEFLKLVDRVYYLDFPPSSFRQRLRNFLNGKRQWSAFNLTPYSADGCVVIPQPLFLPTLGIRTGISKLNEKYGKKIINYYLSKIDLRNTKTIGIVVNPWWASFDKLWDLDIVCYDCVDELSVLWEEHRASDYINWQKELVTRSDILFYTAPKLKEVLLKINPNPPSLVEIPNGVNAEWFRRQSESINLPKDLKDIPSPRVGFVGTLERWIDYELIALTAKKLTHISFVLIGPLFYALGSNKLKNIPNIFMLGKRSYDEVPAYIRLFDVCMMPFKKGEIADHTDPVKIYEYFALGKPVVSTDFPASRKLKSMLYLADNYNDFSFKIENALEEKDEALIRLRMAFANKNTWGNRAEKMLKVIHDISKVF
jgi:glycosyltransferase involved in cell wall biosynthesis